MRQPVSMAQGIHHQRQWREDFGDAVAVERRTDVDGMQRTQTLRLLIIRSTVAAPTSGA
jgi:hypothetical protein